jgi:hypothetical protein
VLVSNNPYALDRPLARGTRPRLNGGQLGIVVLDTPGDSPLVPGRAWSASRLEVDAPGPVHAGVDGEAVDLSVFIGWRAMVIGDVNIGAGAYVCAGALVTRDVPAGYIAYGRNEIVHPTAWPGPLGKSRFFHGTPRSASVTRRLRRQDRLVTHPYDAVGRQADMD